MNRIVTIISLLVLLLQTDLFAQKEKNKNSEKSGYEIVFNIKNASDSVIYMAIHYKGQLYLKDSAFAVPKGHYVFKGEKRLDDGLYTLVSSKRSPYIDFILDKNQYFEFNIDTILNPVNYSVKNSPHNAEMLAFQRQTVNARTESKSLVEKLEKFKSEENSDSVKYYEDQLSKLDEGMQTFIRELIDRNPDYLFSKLQKAYQQIKIPDPPVRADGTIDSSFRAIYYKTHYWDNVDLSDSRMIYLPVLEQKYNDYIKNAIFHLEADSMIKYVDLFLEKTKRDTFMYRYFLDRLTTDFQANQISYDAVYVHLVRSNHQKGKTPWIDEDLLNKFVNKANDLEKVLIGVKPPEIIMPDTTGEKWISSHHLPDKYVILWFYDPTCGECKRESIRLKNLYDSLNRVGARNFEVYGIGVDSDVARWKKYVRDQKFPWINVGGNTANIDYKMAYNIKSNPTFYILNENREIIMNKRIDMNMIPLFLEQYEKMKIEKQK